jgi:hypothetical protein
MKHYTHQGTWWLPGDQDQSVEGTLSFGASGIELLVHGSLLTPALRGRQPQTYGPSDWEAIPVIHGQTIPDRKPMSLLNVEGAPYIVPPGINTENNYLVGTTLSGIHTTQDTFAELRCSFDYLKSWTQPPPLTTYAQGMETVSVQFQEIDLASAGIGPAKVRLVTSAVGNAGSGSVHLEQLVAFVIEFPETNASSIINDWVRPLQDFLTIALGRSVRLTSLFLRPACGKAFAEASFGVVQAEAGPSPKRGSVLSCSAPTLLTFANSPVPFSELLPRWFDIHSKHRAMLNLLLAPYYTSFIFSDHRYASTFQSVEALAKSAVFTTREKSKKAHRARVDAIIAAAKAAHIDEEDILWAQRILQSKNDKPLAAHVMELTASLGIIGEQVLAACPDFAALATRGRTTVSHPARSGLANVERYWLGDVLNWVVRAKVLIETGLPQAEIERRVSQSPSFQYALQHVRLIQVDS